MKVIKKMGVLGIVFIAMVSFSCKKDVVLASLEDQPYEQRLEGIWELTSVEYESEIPNPQNPLQTIEIDGSGEDVEGIFVLGHDPNQLDFSYEFLANIQLVDSVPPIPIPVERDGSGTWSATSDESRIIITEDDQTTYTFIVKVNELNKQVYQTTIEETILGVFTIEVDVELTFVR